MSEQRKGAGQVGLLNNQNVDVVIGPSIITGVGAR